MGIARIGENAIANRGVERVLIQSTENQVVIYDELAKQTKLMESMAESLQTIARATDYVARAESGRQ